MPSPSPLFLSCTKPSSTFCFHQRPHMVKCQSSGFYFRPSSSAGLGPAAPSRQPPQFPLIVPTARSLVPSLPHSPSRPERALLPRCMAKSVPLLPPALESTLYCQNCPTAPVPSTALRTLLCVSTDNQSSPFTA